jgi:nondiscriminating glutamyl-tRNA synthetase
MNVRTRLAPSPTGKMHIGTLRTALFDYFLAKQHGGQFLIRIEDTDQGRLVPGAIENLLEMFQAVNISHDEGPFLQADGAIVEHGDYGPYVQSARLDVYKKYADELVEKGLAYPCFCTAERLDEMRKAQTAVKQTTKYDRHCLALTAAEARSRIDAGEKYVIRIKIPEGKTEFIDAIRGHIAFDNREVDDCIIMKSDGFPTYYLACVVDDQLMNISHILRGEEWISSTPKSLILCSMFGWESPIFAHVPVLLGPDKKKLSKRTGDTAVEEYFKHGYLAEAIVNFIGTLGFNPSGDREIFTFQELVDSFDLSKVNSAGAILNMEKLDWMNRHYLMQLTEDELVSRAARFVSADCSSQRVRRALFVERSRISRMTEFNGAIAPYLELPLYDSSIVVWKKADGADAILQLSGVREVIAGLGAEMFDSVSLLDSQIKEYITSKGLQNGNVLWPLRVALSGLEKSATPFELLWALGQEESLQRIDAAVQKLQQ